MLREQIVKENREKNEHPTILLNLEATSSFDLSSDESTVHFSSGNKRYRFSLRPENTPEFISRTYRILNPLQGLFYLVQNKLFPEKLFSSLILSPTSSGKTGVILLYTKHVLSLLERNGDDNRKPAVVYVAPLKALVRDKYEEFRSVFGNNSVEMRTGDDVIRKPYISSDILVCTPDYLVLAIRNNASFVKNIRAFIVDEVHTIFNSEEKPALDEVLWYIKENSINYLILSATIPLFEKFIEYNPPDLVIKSNWTPVPLEKKYLEIDEYQRYEMDPSLCPFRNKNCSDLCINLKKKGYTEKVKLYISAVLKTLFLNINPDVKKTILFVPSKRIGWLVLEFLNENCGFNVINSEESLHFPKKDHGEDAFIAGFHCADLEVSERVSIEKAFKHDSRFVLLLATQTLAYGVNLPADASAITVRVKSSRSEKTQYVMWPGIIDCIQMGGRAGRFGLSEKGYIYYLIEDGFPIVRRYIENPKSYPFDTALKARNMNNVISYGIFSCVKKKIPVSSCTDNSFLLYSSEIDLEKVSAVFSKLVSGGFILREDNGLILSKKGEFCYHSGISPFTLLVVEELEKLFITGLSNTRREIADTVRFLITVPFTGARYESTLKVFFEKTRTPVSNPDTVISSVMENLPDWHMLRKIFDEREKFFMLMDRSLLEDSNTVRDIYDIISFLFQVTGIYYYSGMPKTQVDLSYVTPSSVIFYIRSLHNIFLYLGKYNIPEIFIFSHLFRYRTPLWTVLLVLYARRKKLELGQVRSGILNLAMQSLDLCQMTERGFFSPEKTIKTQAESILAEKDRFLEVIEEIISIHAKNRKKFRKNTDEQRIIRENREFFTEFVRVLEALKNEDSELLEYGLYDPFIIEVFKKTIYPEVSEKRDIVLRLKVELLSVL